VYIAITIKGNDEHFQIMIVKMMAMMIVMMMAMMIVKNNDDDDHVSQPHIPIKKSEADTSGGQGD